MTTQERTEGRFASVYSVPALRAAIREIATWAAPDDPQQCRQRTFDAARAPAGHPHAPTARACCRRFGKRGMPIAWGDLLRSAFRQRSDVQSAVRVEAQPEEKHLAYHNLYFALRWAAKDLGVETLAPAQYEEARGKVVARTQRRDLQAKALIRLLPTVGQIERIAKNERGRDQSYAELVEWDIALALADLDVRPARIEEEARLHGMPRAKAIYWWVKCTGGAYKPQRTDVDFFAKTARFALERGRDRSWDDYLVEAGKLLAAEGLTLPDEYPPMGIQVPITIPPEGIPGAAPRPTPRSWTRAECVQALRRFLASLRPGQSSTQTQYKAWSKGHADRPGCGVFRHYGGLTQLRQEAEKKNREEGAPTVRAEDAGTTMGDDGGAGADEGAPAAGSAVAPGEERVVARADTDASRGAAGVVELINAGALRVGEQLYHEGHGPRQEGTLTEDGRIKLSGHAKAMTLSAAVRACGSTPSGWYYWSVERGGKAVPLHQIRAAAAEE